MKFCVIGENLIALDLVDYLLTQENDVYWLTHGPVFETPTSKNLHIQSFDYDNLGKLGPMDYLLIVGDNDEENILKASICKEKMEAYILVLIQNHDLARTDLLDLFPYVDEFFYPSETITDQIVHFAVEENGLPQRRFLHPKLNIWSYTLEKGHPIIGKALQNLPLDKTLVVAIYREGDFFIPKGDSLLKQADRLYLLGSGSMEVFRRPDFFLGSKPGRKKFWILGDSLQAKNLTLCLLEEGYDVDLTIPKEENLKAWRQALPKAYVKRGDFTSLSTFTGQSPQDYLGVICASKKDNDNVLMAILARQAGFLKTFSILDYKDYAKATEGVVSGLQLSPRLITASSLFTMIHQPGKVHITPLPGATTEVLELELLKDSPLAGKSLKEMSLPDGVIVGAVLRNRQLIIPSGDLVFKEDDRLIIFAKTSLRDKLLKQIYHKDQESRLRKWIGGRK